MPRSNRVRNQNLPGGTGPKGPVGLIAEERPTRCARRKVRGYAGKWTTRGGGAKAAEFFFKKTQSPKSASLIGSAGGKLDLHINKRNVQKRGKKKPAHIDFSDLV